MTPAIIPVDFDNKVDILAYAFDGIAASGFNASQGAVYLPEQVAWINPAGSVLGKVEYRTNSGRADREPFTIERTDNGAKILYGDDAQGQSSRGQFNVDASGDVEYVITYPEGLPDTIDLKFKGLPEAATALYRFEGLPADVVFQGGTEVGAIAALRNATQTAWTRDGGDLVVRIYADRFVGPEISRSDFASVEAEAFQDEFKNVITGRANANPSGNVSPQSAPMISGAKHRQTRPPSAPKAHRRPSPSAPAMRVCRTPDHGRPVCRMPQISW